MFSRLLPISCAAALILSARVEAQQFDDFDRRRVAAMLDLTRKAIAERYYDSTYHGIDLGARYDTAFARIRSATDIDRALTAVAQFALDLHDSHTFFVPPQRTVRADYGWDAAMVGDSCYVVSVKAGSDAERQGVRPGDAVRSLGGYTPTRDNLWQLMYLYRLLRPQRALRVSLQSPGAALRTLDLAATVRESKRIVDLTGNDGGDDIARLIRDTEKSADEMRAEAVEVGDSVLVWRFPTFDAGAADVEKMLDLARRKRTLILDLRGNSGGPVAVMTRLLGRVSRDPLPIGTGHERGEQSTLVAAGTGDQAFTGQLIVLVDSRSASASEVVARVTQLAKRGRVLGDRTAGAVMQSRYHRYSTGTQMAVFYGVSVTEADLEMSDGGRLEGVGVVPDEVVLPSAADLSAGRDPVLARAMALAGRTMSAEEAGTLVQRGRR